MIDTCISIIDMYQKRDNAGPLIVDVQNKDDLLLIVNHFNVIGNIFVFTSNYAEKDEFPQLDKLLDFIQNSENNIFIRELSTFLKLKGYEVTKQELKSLLSVTIKGHVVILTYQCKNMLLELISEDHRRKESICIIEGKESLLPKLIFIEQDIYSYNDVTIIHGIHNIPEIIEEEIRKEIYIKTAKFRRTFPNSLYYIKELKKAYDLLCYKDSMTRNLPENIVCEDQWSNLLKKFDKFKSWEELINKEIGDFRGQDLLINKYKFFNSEQKLLLFLSLKLYGAKNNYYLNTSIEKTDNEKNFLKRIYRNLLDIDYKDPSFERIYNQRKNLLNAIGNPKEAVIDYCKIVLYKEADAIYYLTDNTQEEKEIIFYILSKYWTGENITKLNTVLNKVYYDLYLYLAPYHFNNSMLMDYFQKYKYQKVINCIIADFEDVVIEQAAKREYNRILEARSSIIETLDRKDSQAFYVDSMGVEFLSYIVAKCNILKMITEVKICRCELPSITSKNKEFLALFENENIPIITIKEIDEIKHHGKNNYDYQTSKLPLHLVRELEIFDDLLDRIRVKLASGEFKKAILISDHGASRLAVIHETETIWEMESKGQHSGRCCPKNEIDIKSEYVVDADDFWVLANYDRFKGGRKANVEVHGGATLEEVTIPIIEITYQENPVEVKIIPVDSTESSNEVPTISISYRKKAAIRLYLTQNLNNVSIHIEGKRYDAVQEGDRFYTVNMPDIREAKKYCVDIYSGNNIIQSGLPLVIKKESGKERDIL